MCSPRHSFLALFVLILQFAFASLLGQVLSYTSIPFDVMRDDRGFVWISTSHGVDRFDGHVTAGRHFLCSFFVEKKMNCANNSSLVTMGR